MWATPTEVIVEKGPRTLVLLQELLGLVASHRITEEALQGFVSTFQEKPKQLPENFNLEGYLADIEREKIRAALIMAEGRRSQAAKLLGVSVRMFRNRLERLGITDSDHV